MKYKIETQAVHQGHRHIEGSVNLPIFQSSTYLYEGAESYDAVRYHRLNNAPNQLAVAETIAALEGGEDGLVLASGMAAITCSLLAMVGKGETLLTQKGLYGGTQGFLDRHFQDFGRSYQSFSLDQDLRSLNLSPTVRAIYLEAASNPTLTIPDFDAIIAFAKERGLLTILDNTLMTPVNFRPISRGIDLVVHSATKYLNGHSDIIAGAVVGSAEHVGKVRGLANYFGPSLDANSCFLLHRGLKTISLRVRQQNQTALEVATVLAAHPKVQRVVYPGLSSHPHHERAVKYFAGHGGMFGFEPIGTSVDAMLQRLKLGFIAPSLGGCETLVTRPCTTSHAGLSASQLSEVGISPNFVRVSVGLENADDLIADFLQALADHPA